MRRSRIGSRICVQFQCLNALIWGSMGISVGVGIHELGENVNVDVPWPLMISGCLRKEVVRWKRKISVHTHRLLSHK